MARPPTKEKPQTKAEVDPAQQVALIKTQGEMVKVTFNDVKTLICPLATDQETVMFLRTCQSLQLDPFANEVFLIKYQEQEKAALVISISSYLKAAENNEKYDGHEAGIILKDSGGKLEFREGNILLKDEEDKLAGGWARVYRKDRSRPVYMAVNKAECVRHTRDGQLTKFWAKDKQPGMLRKVALMRALRESFPSLFSGSLASSDVASDVHEGEWEAMPEDHLPPAMEKNGAPDWKQFWARVKNELGLSTEDARRLLGVSSIKDELTEAGWTMEDIWNTLVSRLQEQKQGPKVDQDVDQEQRAEVNPETGEILVPPDAEGEFGGLDEGPEPAQSVEVDTSWQPKFKRDPATITSLPDLFKVCYEDFKLQPKDVVKQLGYSSQKDIKETPAVCYQTIAAIEG